MTLEWRQGSRLPPRKRCKKAKRWSEEVLEIAKKTGEVKGKGEKERSIHTNAEFQRSKKR